MQNSTDLRINTEAMAGDLKAFFEFVESEELGSGKAALKNKALSPTELRESIPDSAIRVVMSLTDAPSFSLVSETCEASIRPDLERARDLAQEHFAELRSHPAIVKLLKEMLSKSSTEQHDELELNSIAKIGYFPMYVGIAPELTPTVRVAFRSLRGKLLLDSQLDWDDLLYVSKVLADIAADQLQAAESLNEAGMLRIDDKLRGKLAAHISELAHHVDRLQQSAPSYGVQLIED